MFPLSWLTVPSNKKMQRQFIARIFVEFKGPALWNVLFQCFSRIIQNKVVDELSSNEKG